VPTVSSPATPPRACVILAALLGILAALFPPACAFAEEGDAAKFLDLSLLVSTAYPSTWPTFPRVVLDPAERIGPTSPYNSETLAFDGNTGTQLDVPPHSVTPPNSGLANAGEAGLITTDKVPAWQFGGEACVIDCRDLLLEPVSPGQSPLVKKERVIAWEKAHRPLGPGDVVLFRSDYTDKFYRPFPQGRRFIAEPVEAKAAAWPDPDPDCMEYLATRGVMTLGTDSASMGPLPDLAEPTHFAGLRHGMIWTESATRLGSLPTTGAFYCILSPKHQGGPYAESRAIAIVGNPLAARLIEAARKKTAADLSVTLAEELPTTWTGKGVGTHRQPYFKILFGKNPNTKTPFETHMFSSHSGTHLIPPTFALPHQGFNDQRYSAEVGDWLAEYQAKYGPRGTSDMTTEKVPVSQTCGPARVIDVTHRAGSTDRKSWPASPEITVADVDAYESKHGALKPGDVVIFRTGWTDRYYHPVPEGKACMDDPLNGKSEGWPAPGPDLVMHLAKKGIRCVGTDAPSLGGVDSKRALMTYWALGGKNIAGVEFLTNLSQIPDSAYFVFAALKLQGGHGGPGRALAFW
jgi:kynurenine formamidase